MVANPAQAGRHRATTDEHHRKCRRIRLCSSPSFICCSICVPSPARLRRRRGLLWCWIIINRGGRSGLLRPRAPACSTEEEGRAIGRISTAVLRCWPRLLSQLGAHCCGAAEEAGAEEGDMPLFFFSSGAKNRVSGSTPAAADAAMAGEKTAAALRGGGGAAAVVEMDGEDEHDDDQRVCIICLEGEPPLVIQMPCKCRGTIGLIHDHCLAKLRKHSAVCTTCRGSLVSPWRRYGHTCLWCLCSIDRWLLVFAACFCALVFAAVIFAFVFL